MAIGGGGDPAIRVSIINRTLHLGITQNVASGVSKPAQEVAAILIAEPRAMPYVHKTDTIELWQLLRQAGLVESKERDAGASKRTATEQQLRQRLAAALWRNRQLERNSRQQEGRIRDAVQRYAAAHTANGVLSAQIRDLQAMTRELRRQVAQYEGMEPVLPEWAKEIQATMRQWEGGK